MKYEIESARLRTAAAFLYSMNLCEFRAESFAAGN